MGLPVLSAQEPSADPVATTRGLPAYVRLLPKPEVEPWQKITPKERFVQYRQTTFSWVALLQAAAGASISQGVNTPSEWGQGWDSYGVRVGSAYGSRLISNTVIYGASALLHEDTRYFRSKSPKLGGRLAHVIVSPYTARTDSGSTRFSASMFLGSASYAGAQLAWSPKSSQGWDNVGFNYLLWYGQTAGLNFAKELYPSIAQYFRHHKANSGTK